MIYIIICADTRTKDDKIIKLRNKILTSNQSRQFDYDTIDGNRVDASTLKQLLIALPAIAKQRVILVRQAHKLNVQNLQLVEDFSLQSSEHAALILDFDETGKKIQNWIKKIKNAQVLNLETKQKEINVFDVTRCMPNQPAQAIKALNEVYDAGNHPLKVMGGLVWFWGKMKPKVSAEKFKKGLLCLQEADLNIKRSRLKAEYALEVLILKLCSLASY